MTEKKLFLNDIGVLFKVWAKVDVSTAASIIIKVEKPSGEIASWTGAVSGTNKYYAVYTTQEGDLDEEGIWKLSLVVTYVDGSTYTGASDKFQVYEQFEDIDYEDGRCKY